MLQVSISLAHTQKVEQMSVKLQGQIYKQYIDNQSPIHKLLPTRHTQKYCGPNVRMHSSLHHHMGLEHLAQVPLPFRFFPFLQYFYPQKDLLYGQKDL